MSIKEYCDVIGPLETAQLW